MRPELTPEKREQAMKDIIADKENGEAYAKGLADLVHKHYPKAGTSYKDTAFAVNGMAMAIGGTLSVASLLVGKPSEEMRKRMLQSLFDKIEKAFTTGDEFLNPDSPDFQELLAGILKNKNRKGENEPSSN